MRALIPALLFFAIGVNAACPSNAVCATAFLDGTKISIAKGLNASGVAMGSFSAGSNHPSNFGELNIKTNNNFTDKEQMRALGVLEGSLTASQIYDEVINLREPVLVHYGHLPSTTPPKALTDWLTRNDAWVRRQADSKAATDPYWRSLQLILLQFDGLIEGYAAALEEARRNNSAPKMKALDVFDFQMLNGIGDFFDLIPAIFPELRRDFDNMGKVS
jgi:hypothetical protein